MDIEQLRNYSIAKPDAEECFPFGPETIVFKVKGKIFLLAPLDAQPLSFNVKCDPEKALELRERYTCVQPGYHMNKKYWNTIFVDGSMARHELQEQIDHSYELVSAAGKKFKKGNKENLACVMITTTTPFIEGKPVQQYLGIISSEAIIGANVFKDLLANLRDIAGGRSATYEKIIDEARTIAMNELVQKAQTLGANAIIGVDFDYETIAATGSMLMVLATGTAVII